VINPTVISERQWKALDLKGAEASRGNTLMCSGGAGLFTCASVVYLYPSKADRDPQTVRYILAHHANSGVINMPGPSDIPDFIKNDADLKNGRMVYATPWRVAGDLEVVKKTFAEVSRDSDVRAAGYFKQGLQHFGVQWGKDGTGKMTVFLGERI